MKLPIILLFGVGCLHWTAATEPNHGDLLLDLDGGILKSVIPTTNSSYINLSGLQIEYIAEAALINLTNVRSLNLSNNELRRAPRLSKYPQLHNLEELSFANNQLTLLDGTFDKLKNLKRVDISNNSLTSISDEDLSGLTNSTEIIIEGNPISWISPRAFEKRLSPDSLMRIKKSAPISSLGIYANISSLKKRVAKNFGAVRMYLNNGIMTSVEELQQNETLDNYDKAPLRRVPLSNRGVILNLSKFKIETFQRGWYKLTDDSIKEIDFSNNRISHIEPELLNDLPSGVSTVRIKRNFLQTIEKDVIVNRYLKLLVLDDNDILTIEAGAFERTNLTFLCTANNNLKDLAFVSTLPRNLEVLDVSFNRIEEIPVNIFRNLKNLKFIHLVKNRIKRIESGTFLGQENLEFLNLEDNRIDELNSGQFKGLTEVRIDLRRNRIKRIPRRVFSEIGASSQISVYLSGNNINIIEEESFSNLNIRILDLSLINITEEAIEEGAFENSTFSNLLLNDNLLTEINSEWFKGISKMQNLELARNRIKNIRQGTAKYMGDLDSLDLSGNPIEILQNGALYGLSKEKDVRVYIKGAIKIIQGGSFDDV